MQDLDANTRNTVLFYRTAYEGNPREAVWPQSIRRHRLALLGRSPEET